MADQTSQTDAPQQEDFKQQLDRQATETRANQQQHQTNPVIEKSEHFLRP